MLQQTPGKIFLADERGLAESDRFRRYSTFSFGEFAHPHKGPFGRLYGCNEETLAGGHTVAFTVAEASYLLLVPLTGAVRVSWGEPASTLAAEEALLLAVPAGTVLQVSNPFAGELVHFLHLWLLADAPVAAVAAHPAAFDLGAQPNALLALVPPFAPPRPVRVHLGRFAGRYETTYRPQHPGADVFLFVLAGAFEAEGRLLHEKDGLALWNATEIELEALSNDAIVLLLELEPAKHG